MTRSTVEGAVFGVQRAEHQVAPSPPSPARWRWSSKIAQLSHQHDVRILAQRGPQRRLEALRVHAHLALVHEAALVLVHELESDPRW